MSKKAMKTSAIIIVVVFLVTIVVYPLIFSPDPEPNQETTPVQLELNK